MTTKSIDEKIYVDQEDDDKYNFKTSSNFVSFSENKNEVV